MIDQSESKHVGENIMYTNRMYIYIYIYILPKSVFSWDLIKSEAIYMEDVKY